MKLTGFGDVLYASCSNKHSHLQAISSPSHGSLLPYFPLDQFCYKHALLSPSAETRYAEIN
jgi:hypothetical protein